MKRLILTLAALALLLGSGGQATAGLNGCTVVVDGDPKKPTVYHFNARDKGAKLTFTLPEEQAKMDTAVREKVIDMENRFKIARGSKPVAILKSIDQSHAEIAERRAAAFGCLSGAFAPPSDTALFTPLADAELGLVDEPTAKSTSRSRRRKPA